MDKKQVIEFLESLIKNPDEFKSSIPEDRFKELQLKVSEILKRAFYENLTANQVLDEIKKIAKTDEEYANCLLSYIVFLGAAQFWAHAKLMGYL